MLTCEQDGKSFGVTSKMGTNKRCNIVGGGGGGGGGMGGLTNQKK